MDQQTIEIYNQEAEAIADFHSTLVPQRLYDLALMYFKPGLTLDIGCGMGRDTHWLRQNVGPTIGVDASVSMLEQAANRYGSSEWVLDSLPKLGTLQEVSATNILCSGVLMHLGPADAKAAMKRMIQLLKPEGVLLVSIRQTLEPSGRENGKLYTSLVESDLVESIAIDGAVLRVSIQEADQCGRMWTTLVFQRR